mgnify:CR=1 FL=1
MKKVLIVVDYQVDFVNGSLGFEDGKSIEKFIVSKLEEYIENKDSIIFTFDTHDEKTYFDSVEGSFIPIKHCIENTPGWQLYGDVRKYEKYGIKFLKNTFGSLDLGNYLKKEKFDYIELVGLISNICLFSNAVIAKMACPNSKIIVLKDGTSTLVNGKDYDIKIIHILVIRIVKIISDIWNVKIER